MNPMASADISRLRGVLESLRKWNRSPSVTIPQAQFLTGLSRTRVCELLRLGVVRSFVDTVRNEILLKSFVEYYANRVSKLSVRWSFRRKVPK